ncbi:hypothetical protein DFH09DRAFT_1285315 [Mycena vulgaris]|nr:hypothetical protein DFH09DRAFT_1285315 [Mycena vulgaris]
MFDDTNPDIIVIQIGEFSRPEFNYFAYVPCKPHGIPRKEIRVRLSLSGDIKFYQLGRNRRQPKRKCLIAATMIRTRGGRNEYKYRRMRGGGGNGRCEEFSKSGGRLMELFHRAGRKVLTPLVDSKEHFLHLLCLGPRRDLAQNAPQRLADLGPTYPHRQPGPGCDLPNRYTDDVDLHGGSARARDGPKQGCAVEVQCQPR